MSTTPHQFVLEHNGSDWTGTFQQTVRHMFGDLLSDGEPIDVLLGSELDLPDVPVTVVSMGDAGLETADGEIFGFGDFIRVVLP